MFVHFLNTAKAYILTLRNLQNYLTLNLFYFYLTLFGVLILILINVMKKFRLRCTYDELNK